MRAIAAPTTISPPKTAPTRGPAWQAAETSGVDMSLLEHSLSLTVWERLVEHQHALNLLQHLERTKIKR